MWYKNFIVFVIFVVVDETISGKVLAILITMQMQRWDAGRK
jgi:hypothetical protein